MFTGIILDVGSIVQLDSKGADLSVWIKPSKLPYDDITLGDSIAINGVCLTVTEFNAEGICFDVSAETLSKTTFGNLAVNDRVNLEKALTPATALGGHLVSGHVDGVGEIIRREPDARSERFKIKVPDALSKYIASKGSVCIDGVSLTINTVEHGLFDVNIVPHTLKETIFSDYEAGRAVNIEVDIIARYLERLLESRNPV